jgi:tetratricopeptide (TPR) repeat protein
VALPSTPHVLVDACRALARGDVPRARALVERDDTALGLTLRGLACALLGEVAGARALLQRAAPRAKAGLPRAQIRAALVELALADADPGGVVRAARASSAELSRLGDATNAALQRLVLARAEVLAGRLCEAREVVDALLAETLPPALRALGSLVQASIATSAVAPTEARRALTRARAALEAAPNGQLARALVALEAELSRPVARLQQRALVRDADLFAVEAASSGALFLVDACRRRIVTGHAALPLAGQPARFALVAALARAWPSPAPRDALAATFSPTARVTASHRARVGVELGRLRRALRGLAELREAADGVALVTPSEVVLLLPSSGEAPALIGLLLGDGAWWSAGALAERAGISKRAASRELAARVDAGGAVRAGKGAAARYARPAPPIASRMVLLGLVPTA